MTRSLRSWSLTVLASAVTLSPLSLLAVRADDAAKTSPKGDAALVRPGDWNQWAGSPARNNVAEATDLPIEWEIGGFDRKTGAWKKDSAQNVLWVSALGSQSYGNPVVANGKVYVGSASGSYQTTLDVGKPTASSGGVFRIPASTRNKLETKPETKDPSRAR